jgi:hypothetical protein
MKTLKNKNNITSKKKFGFINSNKLSFQEKYKKLIKLQCSPSSKKKSNKSYSCLTDEALFQLKEMWNKRHPDAIIKFKSPFDIWNSLQLYLSNVCDKESCWLTQKFTNGKMKKILEGSFAPKSPDLWKINPNEWLSSVDISNVMRQYEEAYSCFKFLGPSPIDFDYRNMEECVWPELCNFQLKDEINKNISKIGIIFNLDPHYKSGSHWISLFINIKKSNIFFFDSAGEKIPNEVKELVDKIIDQGKKLSINFTFDQNHPVEHQFGDTECGIYSLFFIIYMLEDAIDGKHLKKKIYKDKYIEKYRKVFFNQEL